MDDSRKDDDMLEQMAACLSMLANAALGMVVDRARDVVAAKPNSKERDDAVELLAERIRSFDESVGLVHSWLQRMRVRELYGWAAESEYERRAREGGE